MKTLYRISIIGVVLLLTVRFIRLLFTAVGIPAGIMAICALYVYLDAEYIHFGWIRVLQCLGGFVYATVFLYLFGFFDDKVSTVRKEKSSV